PEASSVESELQQIRDLLVSQSKELEATHQQLREQQEKIATLESQLNAADASHESVAASPAAGAIGVNPSTTSASTAATAPIAANGGGERADEPTSIHYKGITLTPGGFLAAESVWRQRALSADVNTPFNSVPFPGSSQSQVSEFNASGRQSRLSLLAEGKLDHAKLTGYYETDFLSAGVTSNSNSSNSYTMRQRQIWGQAALDSGWTFTGGQMWSLVTETKKGVENRTEATPLVIDAQYNVRFSWARQYGFRVSKDFGDKFWLAFAVENPQTIFGGHGFSSTSPNFLLGALGSGGGLYNATANYSFNATPDFIFKAAWEPGWGHYEVFGIVSSFRDRIFPCAETVAPATCSGVTGPSGLGAFNDTRGGGGIGVNARAPLFAKHLDVGIHFLGGSGVGRYGTAGLPDATVRPDGTLALIRSYQGLGTLEWHATPKLDIYAYVGGEFDARAAYLTSSGKGYGYGSTFFNNYGCSTETAPGGNYVPGTLGNCTGDTRNIIEGTLGFWYRFYKGPKGTLQWGPQYSYVVRNTWSGVGTGTVNGTVVNTKGAPNGIDNMIFTSFRYYLP
ncbi:MAG: hypothetical protein ACRD41_03750, partial [Candidatus Acidiferrales bacterium]